MVTQTSRLISLLLVAFALTLTPALAQSPPAAQITNDEGGPVRLTGGGRYTNVLETGQMGEPVVVLLDQGGLYAHRNPAFVARPEGQIFGRFTSDFSPGSFAFQIDLPAEPQGQQIDVDQDGGHDPGVQIWTIAIRNNPLAEPFEPLLLPLEQVNTPWLTSVLTRKPSTPDGTPEPYSGSLLIYAADQGQGFPAGLGDDGVLFTADDPIVGLPPGYTLVKLDETPFAFDRSREVKVFIPEDPNSTTASFADLNYKDAFNAFIDFMKERYAYTDLHQIDWEGWRSEYLPRVEQAQGNADALAYSNIYQEIAVRTGDRHTRLVGPIMNTETSLASVELGVGLEADFQVRNGALFVKPGLLELDDGRVLVINIKPDSSAAKAGIEPLAEIISVNDTPIGEQLETLAAESHAATPETRRLEALQQLLLLPPESSVKVTYRNPGKEENTVTLGTGPVALEDLAGLTGDFFGSPGSLPPLATTARPTPGGQTVGYISWPDFLNDQIKLPLLSNYLAGLKAGQPPGLIIDLRHNSGGSEWLMTTIFSYFFSPDFPARLELLASSSFDVARNEFVTYPAFGIPPRLPISAPSPETYYGGKVIILVSENCVGACEFFTAWMKMYGRATIIGPHATAGAGGQVQQIQLPEGMVFNYTYSRQTDRQGNTYIEGVGIQPDVRVPLTEAYAAALVNGQDPVLDFALARMDQLLAGQPLTGGGSAAAANGDACAATQAVTVTGQPPGREMYRPFDDEAIDRAEVLGQTTELSGPTNSAAAWRNSILKILGDCTDDAFVPKQITVYNTAPDQTTVVVFTELRYDDSLAGEEVRVDLKAAGEKQWQIDWAGVRFKCARGNTADLTKEFCP